MNAQFWLNRWQEGRTRWHGNVPNPLLVEYWPAIGAPADARVLVPLCGKSLDMPWLAAQGHRILGVELSPLAIAQFFAENALEAHTDPAAIPPRHVSGPIELVQSDIFNVPPQIFASCDAIYDRAAIIALDPAQRQRYARRVYDHLPPGCRGLMITLEYPPEQMEGPPFSVSEEEVRTLLAEQWQIDLLTRRDILADSPNFADQGLSALSTAVYRLHKQR